MSSEKKKPKVAVFKFASCDGCQLSLLDAEDELLPVVGAVDIAYFPEASRTMLKGPYDIGLVEGSITTHHDAERIQQVRRQCEVLVTIGACATAGGIQALRNWSDKDEYVRTVYARPDFIQTLKMSTPIAEHVPVDFELRGCPINKKHLIELISATLAGRKPNIPTHSLCMKCKRSGNVCITIARGVPCLGPVTQSGLRRAVPAVRAWLLRVLRSGGEREHGGDDQDAPGAGAERRRDCPLVPQLQRVGVAVQTSKRGSGEGLRATCTRSSPVHHRLTSGGASWRRRCGATATRAMR